MVKFDASEGDGSTMTAEYRSKIDWWLAAVMAVSMAVSVYASIEVVLAGSLTVWWLLPLIAISGIGMPLWLLLRTRYILEPTHLLALKTSPYSKRMIHIVFQEQETTQ